MNYSDIFSARKTLTFILISVLLVSCAIKNAEKTTDYSQSVHWLSMPAPIKPVDVFYLYPTCWHRTDKTTPIICKIDNPLMLAGSKTKFSMQATAFESVGNIYAPYYRQEDAGYVTTLPMEEQLKIIGGFPALDATAAFDYYIRHFNNGRPFILAGHSQGSYVLQFILSDFMKKNPDVYARMIAAYVIGCPTTPAYLAENPHLKFATGADDTGVIISFNTEAPDLTINNAVLAPGCLVINPISWKRDETPATIAEGLGSFMKDSTGTLTRIPQYADARINLSRGVVECSTGNIDKLAPGNAIFGRGIYHSYDYAFYYFNIRANAENRTKKYLAK